MWITIKGKEYFQVILNNEFGRSMFVFTRKETEEAQRRAKKLKSMI